MWKRRMAYLLTLVLLAPLALTWNARQAQAQQAEKKPKDREEYDLFNNILKETDPAKKIALLDTWKQKYAQTDYEEERWKFYMQAYQQANQPARAVEAAKEVLKLAPKDFSAHFTIASLVPFLGSADAPVLADAKSSAQGLLTAERPPNVADADWANAQKAGQFLAHQALGWAAMQEKNNELAEQEFIKALEANAQAAQVSFWLGTVVQAQRNAEKNTLALFSFARAAAYDGPGALAPAGRQQVDAFLTKAYNNYHGEDAQGLAELKKLARTNALPPPDFKILTKEELEAKRLQELQEKDPLLAVFVQIKDGLTAEGGDGLWQDMKGKGMPPMKGTVVSATPAARPRTLTLAMTQPREPEVTLTLDEPLPRAVPEGTVLTFEGAEAVEFTASPFMLKLQGGKITSGLPQPAAPAKKAPAKKAPKK
jgi:hypothetical protein